MKSFPKAAIRFMWLVSLLGAAFFALLLIHYQPARWPWTQIFIFSAFVCAAELAPVSLPRDSSWVTVGFPISYAALLLFGPAPGTLVEILGFLAGLSILRGRHFLQLYLFFIYNTAQMALAAGICGLIYLWAGGVPLTEAAAANPGGFGKLQVVPVIPLLAGAAGFFLVNELISAICSALLEGTRFRVIWVTNVQITAISYLVFTPFAALIAMLYSQVSAWTIVPFFVPFIAARQCLSLYMRRLETYMGTVSMLGTMTMRYHPYTREHLEAVALWAERIASKLRLPIRKTLDIRLAGMLHDVGKIGVGEIILDKKGKLSEEDWTLIKGHPVKGADILARMKHFEEIVPWVLHHHERMDGKGYPKGLRGEEIPFEARIIAVADSFHAMMSKERSYRTPMSLEEAKEELRRGSGTQWDPRVVEAMLAILEAR